jgi:hypothetical protein
MQREHSSFYRKWLKAWMNGDLIDIEGQYAYIWKYLQDLRLEPPYEPLLAQLLRLRTAYLEAPDRTLVFYICMWASDCYILTQRYDEALTVFPDIPIDTRSSANADCLLSLKYAASQSPRGKDIIPLYGAQLTSFGRSNLLQISMYLDVLLDNYELHHSRLLPNWASASSSHKYGVFRGSPFGYRATQSHNLLGYSFSLNKDILEFVKTITRDAENTVREEMGLPHVGEGWISETQLYYMVKEAFPKLEVIHHARPEWLGRQHLDIFLPQINLAFEYQGLQHDQPVAFFGGQEAFEENQKRDARKLRLCNKNNVRLVQVRAGYVFDEIKTLISESIRES